MARERLAPIEILDMSRGLNKFSSPSLVTSQELTDSENIRHHGAGKLRRRGGMKLFSGSGVVPNQAVTTDKDGRFVVPYLRKTGIDVANKRAFIEAALAIKNYLYRDTDGAGMVTIKLKGHASNAPAFLGWFPYSTIAGGRSFEVFPNSGSGFLDDRIYIGTNLTYEDLTSGAPSYPYAVFITVADSSSFSAGTVVTGGTSGGTGTVGHVDSTNDILFVYNWNNINFTDAETLSHGGGSSTITNSAEFGLAGVVLDNDFTATSSWKARKWGISKPLSAVTFSGLNSTGSVEIDINYSVQYTFLRHENGTLVAGINQKLTGGQLISESAPSPVNATVLITGTDDTIQYDIWEASPDPQVTHVRFYRTDGSTDILRHVCDAAIGAASVQDGFAIVTLQLEPIQLPTANYKTFGEDGENSGYIIESAKHRVYVAGNKNNPNKVYISPDTNLHKDSEYFNSSITMTESPGESITAMKWWNNVLYVFMERSIFRLTDLSFEGQSGEVVNVKGHEIITRGLGCAARHGVLDMGEFLLVLSENGFVRFNGVTFDKIPLSLGFNDLLGRNLLNARLSRSDDYVFLTTETSLASNLILTMKYSDGTFALGTDKLNTAIKPPEAFGFVPELTNFGNTVDDSDFMLSIVKNPVDNVDGKVYYYLAKYDLLGQNKDLLFQSDTNDTQHVILTKFSPRVIDFGSFVEARLEEVIAFIASLGDETTTLKAPSGEWLIRIYLNFAKDGTSEGYEEILLKPKFDRNKTLTLNAGDPIQPKFTKPFDATHKHQAGGVYSNGENPAGLLADYQQILFSGGVSTATIGRLWKLIFEYKSDDNFEFTNFAMKFVREEQNL